jgi:hypothetical protein
MNPLERYLSLLKEFEQSLGRHLTAEEKDFIKWMVEQDLENLSKDTSPYVLCNG